MAEVIIKEAVVERLIPGHGFVVAEQFQDRSGETRKRYYTVWSDESVDSGDVVNVRGLLTVKLDEYTNKAGEQVKSAAAHVNNPKVEKEMPF
jgi:hypothetical protein